MKRRAIDLLKFVRLQQEQDGLTRRVHGSRFAPFATANVRFGI